ncbi:MAG: tetratricopeptide repeat protein [Elusimicrobiota bacterium]
MKLHTLSMLACAVCAMSTPIAGAADGVDWTRAKTLYTDGRYTLAKEAFQELARHHDPSGWAALYNAGNAAYKAGLIPEAIEAYWQALRVNPRHSGLRHNITLAMARSGENLAPQGVPDGLYKAWMLLNLQECTTLTIFFFYASCLAFWLLRRRPATPHIFAATVISLILLSLMTTLTTAKYWSSKNDWHVLKVAAMLRSGPSPNLPVTAQIPEGRLIRVITSQDGWTQIVSRKENLKGWIRD